MGSTSSVPSEARRKGRVCSSMLSAVLFTGARRVPSRAAGAALQRGLLNGWESEDSLMISVLLTLLHPVPSQDSCGRGIPLELDPGWEISRPTT